MRHPDWLERLTQYLETCRAIPFHPVSHNCATFVAGALEALTGEDHYARAGIGRPESVVDVARTLAKYGGVRGIMNHVLGEMKPPLLGRRGDIAVVDGWDGETLGVVEDARVLCVCHDGMFPTPLEKAHGIWTVP